MNPTSRCLFAAVLVLASLLACSCSGSLDESEVDSCCEAVEPGPPVLTVPLSDVSIYQLDHVFRDQHNQERRLVDYRGQPVLIAMIFTHCSYACPAIITDIKRAVAAAVAQDAPAAPRVLLVSMDVKRDQPEVLAKFAKQQDLDPARYVLLHGDDDAVAEVAAVLGVRFSEVDGGDFSHSNQIALLDREGQILYRHQGLAVDIADLVDAIKQLP